MDIVFREEQKKILEYTGGIMSISAVPGAGKTFILVHLVKKLVGKLGEGEKILLLTYMNSAVRNFEERIAQLIPEDLMAKVEIKTIHKFAGDILKENLEYSSLSEDYSLIDAYDRDRIITKIYKRWFSSNRDKLDFLFKEGLRDKSNYSDLEITLKRAVMNLISDFKMEGLDYRLLISETKGYKKESLIPIAAGIYGEYQEELNRRNALDYDDLLLRSYNLVIGSSGLKKVLQLKYRYIFEDEAQDSNKLQNKILALLTQKGGNLVKVGDSNQSIMGTFTASTPEIFRRFIKGAPIKREMSNAGRSSKEVIALANYWNRYSNQKHPCIEARTALVKPYIKLAPPGELPANPIVENGSLGQILAKDEYEEVNKLIYYIKRFIEHYPEKTIGILVPRNSLISSISIKLKKEGIEFGTIGDIDVVTMEILKKVGDYIAYIAEPFNSKNFITLIKNYYLPKGEHLDKGIDKFIKGIDMDILIYGEVEYPEAIKGSSHFEAFKEAKLQIKHLLEFSTNGPDRLLIYMSDLFALELEQRALLENIAINLKKVFKFNPKWTLKDLAIELRRTQNNKFGWFSPLMKDKKDEQKKVTITNYHRSKGREWDMVYLFGLNSFYFPIYLSQVAYGDKGYLAEPYLNIEAYMKWELEVFMGLKDYKDPILEYKKDRIAEGIRLIYVGITRAKEYLLLSHNLEKDDYYNYLFKKLIERSRDE